MTSPGERRGPPPTIPAYEMEWWGARNGRRRSSSVTFPSATDRTIVASSASASASGGRRPGIVRASIVFPDPGGPTSRRPCPPASATSSARRASTWPRTSARSGQSGSGPGVVRATGPPGPELAPTVTEMSSTRAGTGPRRTPRRGRRTASTASARLAAPITSRPPARRASATPSAGTTTLRTPCRASAATIGRMPGTVRSSPPSDSSPTSAVRVAARTCSEPRRIASAIPRSIEAPPFGRSAGARLTVIRRGGNA